MKTARSARYTAPLTLTRRSFTAAAALSALVPPTMGLAQDTAPGFTFYGSAPSDPQSWADALRLDPAHFAPGQFEWWYSDGHLSNGVTFVASWHLEIDAEGNPQPYITVNFAKNDEVLLDRKIRFEASQAHYGRGICDVRIGRHFIRSLDGLNATNSLSTPRPTAATVSTSNWIARCRATTPGLMTGATPRGPTSAGCARFRMAR